MREIVENAGDCVICGRLCKTLPPSLALSPTQLGGGLLWALKLSLGPGPHVHKITNAPVVLMAWDVKWISSGQYALLGPFIGVGPEFSTFLGPNGTRFARAIPGPKKVSNSGPTPINGPRNAYCPLEIHYVPRH